MNRLYFKISVVLAAILALLVSCFHDPAKNNTLRVSGNLRVYQAGDYIRYDVTGEMSYPLLDGSGNTVIALGSNNCPAPNFQFGIPCILSESLDLRDSQGNTVQPAQLEVSWSAYNPPAGTLNSGVTGAPTVTNVMVETWKLTPSNPNIAGTFQTTRYITQINGGDIRGQTVLHAYSTPGAINDIPDTAYFINRSGQTPDTVSNALIEDSPLTLNETRQVSFNLLNNCNSTTCNELARSGVSISVGNISNRVYSAFRNAPIEVIEMSKSFDTILNGVDGTGSVITQLPADTSNSLGLSFFTQCDSLRLMTGANPLPIVEAYNTGAFYLFPQVGAMEIDNSCYFGQVVDYPLGVMKQLSATGSYDPEGNPLSYNWTVESTATNYTVLGTTNVLAGFYAYDAGDYKVTVTASDGSLASKDIMYVRVFNSVAEYQNLPLAFAGQNLYSAPNIEVILDAGQSTGTNLSYTWQVVSSPNGSSVSIADTAAERTTFTANTQGEYQIDLTVSDGNANTSTDTLFVYVQPSGTLDHYPVVSANSLYRYYPVNGAIQSQLIYSDLSINATISATNIAVPGQ